ncbi:DUF155-domain-containing protein [Cylindrobasidium torrendii FP15055 ss-10]|uniref:DUF155-domain-containing protein n=1 Tax=Cylindrobasidium torrendii FP15055 ss-10 TaxID=1314674 RepID=A0A0D7B963_9AGAR|nr:DUF155-domain-containing protein [Cylindrobasidium torrendii FP15055 ss-10]
MSRPPPPLRLPSSAKLRRNGESRRQASATHRTSKTSQKLVVLPSAPQTKPLAAEEDELDYETDVGHGRAHKTEGEKMSKDQRERAGFKRLTAYCVAESLNAKLLASYLKREHNVFPRVFDEALYVMYHLPLLPGYGPSSNIRSSAPPNPEDRKNIMSRLSEAEENGYQGTYFPAEETHSHRDGYISTSPATTRTMRRRPSDSEAEEPEHAAAVSDTEAEVEAEVPANPPQPPRRSNTVPADLTDEDEVAEVVFFDYGVAVFFNMTEHQERTILDDLRNAQIMGRKIRHDDWEVEECHYAHDPYVLYPRIYNDFFTLKSRSHLLKLSIAHALAQSTLLARYETDAQRVLSAPTTLSIPKQLANGGSLQLKRHEALKLTGRLFKLRRDVNLVSNVLDVPELFWSEASLKELYDAVREYMEIKPRVQVLNDKLGVASDFLDAIHEHLNNTAMDRITWIVIWLIVVAIVVDLGEVVARLIFHATVETKVVDAMSRTDVLSILDRMAEL